MIKPDIIIAWPRNCDYPLWRQFIHDNRERFNVIVVVFTETHSGADYRQFVREAMAKDWILFAENPIVHGEDWRNVAVNHALIQSYNAPWVWFTEQDFLPEPGFWETVENYESQGIKAIGVKQGDRLHPCSLFLHRDVISKLDMNVSANPPHYDHFGFIQKQLEDTNTPIGIVPENYWQHMNGLSHNMRLVEEGGAPNYYPEVFNAYAKKCLEVTVPQHEGFRALLQAYLDRIK